MKKSALIGLLIFCALVGMAAANQKRLMVLNNASFDLAGDRVKVTAQFTNITNKPLGKVFLFVRCVNAAGNPVVGADEQVTFPNKEIAPRVPGTFKLDAGGGINVESIKACSCSLAVEKDGRMLEQDTYSVQIR